MAKAFRTAARAKAAGEGGSPVAVPDVPAPGPVRQTEGVSGLEWNVLGQTYLPKAISASSFAWHAIFPPRTVLPSHLHAEQDELVYVLEGRFDFLIDGRESYATQFDLVSLPRGVPHAVLNKSRHICKCLCWTAPTGDLPALFQAIHDLPRQTPEAVAELGPRHGVTFLG